VISWFLPYSDAVNKDNRVKEEKPDLWTKAHRQGARAEEFVRRFVEKSLTDANIGVFNPFHDQRYKNGTCVSNWSERHVAYISGLGTFGLSKNLITEKGAAGRMCSFIVDHEFTPTKRTYEGVYDNCIKCLACVARCPVGAIKKDGKIIGICARHVLTGKGGPDAIICGKCLTGVPCENCNPNPKAKAATTHPAPVA
jgi:epoxyqueuosine reductase QueG